MAVINILDKHTAELIAAGEVVERPASVVKELVENSIDAGATQITVSIEQGGTKSIIVQDNGSGIEAEFISVAFIRHATSKIQTESDLDAISTLGFRGEALASIAAVSRTELLTKTEADEFACLYKQEGGQEISAEAAARPNGTTITVKDIFYNVPARMKFLKKDQSEGNFIGDVVLKQALAHPEISFKFIRDNKEQFHTPGDGKLLTAIHSLLAKDFAKNILEIDYKSGVYELTGYVTSPNACRGSRGMQYFYVNGRYLQNSTMTAAIDAAFKGVKMIGKFPGCVLNITIPPQKIDVNVHPAKTEVRFDNNAEIFQLFYRAVKMIVSSNEVPQKEIVINQDLPQLKTSEIVKQSDYSEKIIDTNKHISVDNKHFDNTNDLDVSIINSPLTMIENEKLDFGDGINPLLQTSAALYNSVKNRHVSIDIDVDDATGQVTECNEKINDVKTDLTEEVVSLLNEVSNSKDNDLDVIYIGEIFKTYILADYDNSLLIIDKHAAHERILYENLIKNYGDADGQMLLSPETVTMSANAKTAVQENEETLRKAGFDIEDFGGASVLVRAVPTIVSTENVVVLIEEIAEKLIQNNKDTLGEKADWVLHSIACRAAIKAGDTTNREALLSLAKQILLGDIPQFCPHGRPVVTKLSKKELEKQFGRIQ